MTVDKVNHLSSITACESSIHGESGSKITLTSNGFTNLTVGFPDISPTQ